MAVASDSCIQEHVRPGTADNRPHSIADTQHSLLGAQNLCCGGGGRVGGLQRQGWRMRAGGWGNMVREKARVYHVEGHNLQGANHAAEIHMNTQEYACCSMPMLQT